MNKLEQMIDKCIIEESYDINITDKEYKEMNKNLSNLEKIFNLMKT